MKFYVRCEEIDERPIYITGNFNGWNPKDSEFILEPYEDFEDVFTIEIKDNLLPEKIEYKFTKGGWENVEIDKYGNVTANRKADKKQKEAKDVVEKWRINWGPFKKEFFPIAELISEKFFMPQLNKTRKVWALLPFDYHNSEKNYPVLYLQDAQNLFNEGSEFGNWEIDKKLSILAEYGRGDIIIIAIENGSDDRIKEYILDKSSLTDNAEGKKYIRFVTDTLKPYVDSVYRTKQEREFTGIGGSSLGALISIYGGFLYPEVYSKLLIFSPSLWLNPENNFQLLNFKNKYHTKVYLYGGEKEGSKMVERIHKFEDALDHWEMTESLDFETKVSINSEGEHQEFYWSQEFPRAIEWLFFDSKEDAQKIANREIILNENSEI